MERASWSSSQKGRIKLGDEKQPDGPSRIIPVKKEHLEDGILQLLASAADMQQRRDLDSALQLYQAAMEKVKSHDLNRKRLLTGTKKKPPPLNSRTPCTSAFGSKQFLIRLIFGFVRHLARAIFSLDMSHDSNLAPK